MNGKKTENQNYRRVNSCEFCSRIECGKRKPDMTCDDFDEAGFVKLIPGLPAMARRDWEILAG